VLVAEVPLINTSTLASRIGQTFPLLCGGLAIALALESVRRRLKTA
jgi:apolipoprotein N-acyltransferase